MSRLRRQRRVVVCQQLVELVTDYLEGDLAPAHRAAVEAHLAQCGHCTGYVEQVRRMLELTAALPSGGQVPEDLLDTLTTRYRRGR
jgi:anti-sigma factor RsiW